MLFCKRNQVDPELPRAPFIVGVPRSGTTLLRMMLDAHSQIAIPPETHFIPKVVEACRGSARDQSEIFIRTVLSSRRWKDFCLSSDSFRERIESLKDFEISAALRTFYKLYAERFGKSRWGDKTPNYLADMRLISEVLPEANFIHVIRDGRDVALSVKDLWFGPRSIDAAAEAWVSGIQSARKQAARLANYVEIRYEDLVRDSENVSKRICEFIDLPWEPGILKYHEYAGERLSEISREIRSPDGELLATADERLIIHAWASKPPEASRICRWKNEMSTTDRKSFEKKAGALLLEFGYLE